MEQQVIAMYRGGLSTQGVADSLGLCSETVRRSLQRLGVSLRTARSGKRKKYVPTSEQVQAMVDLYLHGQSIQTIASSYKLPWFVVRTSLAKAGVELRPGGFRKGEDHHAWVGGRSVDPDGYVHVRIYPSDPFYSMAPGEPVSVDGAKYVLEHRLVMAKKLGRPLFDHETVHHKNNNHSDNAESNLQLRVGNHGKGAVFQCIDCGSHNIEAVELQS